MLFAAGRENRMAQGKRRKDKDAKIAYLDTSLPFEKRVDDLISRMTLDEKVMQMVNSAPAIERLGIPEYDWWNECLHGGSQPIE
jgi:beta-glucosidase